jgi:hypothetical protein
MVRISDIIGALLRGITMARIQADIFSNQASLQYLQSESLKVYPVPRSEIRQADINMKMSILETVQRNVDVNTITLDTLVEALPAYVEQILDIQVKPTSNAPDSQLQPLRNYLGAQLAAATADLIAQLDAWLVQNIATVYTELTGSPSKWGSMTWRDRTLTVVQGVMTARQITVHVSGTIFSKAVQSRSTPWAESMATAVRFAVDMATSAFFDLDIALKKDQILMLPEHVMSELRLSIVVENYEWTTIKDKQGNTINKLTHR